MELDPEECVAKIVKLKSARITSAWLSILNEVAIKFLTL